MASLAGLAVVALAAVVKADDDSNIAFDVACDWSTGATLDGGVRGSPFIIQGKKFPAETLPVGIASNDLIEPAHGVAPIGDWFCRGQVQGAYTPAIASAYASTPSILNTQYYLLNDGRALTLEGYELPDGTGALSVTGGIGGFFGASEDVQFPPGVTLGTNVTGRPNFRAKFRIRRGAN